MYKIKFKGFKRFGGTFIIRFFNEQKQILNQYFFQFSIKNPWVVPHKENRFNNDSWIAGWLLFYIGNIIAKGEVKKNG